MRVNSVGRMLKWIVLLAGAPLAACSHQQHESRSEGQAHAGAHWSYSGATGPAHWGSLSPEYALCATGRSQSPIDVQATAPADLRNIEFHYLPSPVSIVNNGHTIQVDYAPGSFIMLDAERFDLAQFHFHSPSEHRVRGRGAAAELHLVHKSAAGSLAVVGVMIEEGAYNAAFEPVWAHLPPSAGPARQTGTTIDADALLPSDQRTYRYSGSLTTPPGTEGVKWSLMVRPVTMSAEQLAAFRRIISANNRPVQPLNARTVSEDTTR